MDYKDLTAEQKIDVIAEYYGFENQLKILAEECSELAHAALKVGRYPDDPEVHRNLLEEIGDVTIMLAQMDVFLDVQDAAVMGQMMRETLDERLEIMEKEGADIGRMVSGEAEKS